MSVPADLERFHRREPESSEDALLRVSRELVRVTSERDLAVQLQNKAAKQLARARNLTPDHPEYQRIWALGWAAGNEST